MTQLLLLMQVCLMHFGQSFMHNVYDTYPSKQLLFLTIVSRGLVTLCPFFSPDGSINLHNTPRIAQTHPGVPHRQHQSPQWSCVNWCCCSAGTAGVWDIHLPLLPVELSKWSNVTFEA